MTAAVPVSTTTVEPRDVVGRSRRRSALGMVPSYILLCALSLIAAAPFLWMILASFKSGREIRSIPPTFWPREATLDNYRAILDEPDLPLLRFYRNSAFVAFANVASTLFTSSLLGYLLAKFEFRLNKPLFWFLLATLMVPAQVTMIPSYLLLSRLHMLNSLWGLVLPAAISAFGVFLMRQFCLSIPNSLIKAARVDGASEWRIFWSVILPQLKPALATLGLLTFMANWNAYLWPLIVLTEQDNRTLPIILTWFSNQNASRTNITMAAAVLIVLPVVVAFALVQRWIVRGITFTGLK
jgi:multiple sugar transport system permease protein